MPPAQGPVAGTAADMRAAQYDGAADWELAAGLGLVQLVVYDEIGSTMDAAHALAAGGAPAGTAVLADAQTAGRGRHGRTWQSRAGAGVWMTIIERPVDPSGIEVLSLRTGLALADALDPFVEEPVRLKWPNDLLVGGRKLAGILIEARWRETRVDWLAIGIGLNVQPPPEAGLGALRRGVRRRDVLPAVVQAVRGAAARTRQLSAGELAAFRARDYAFGRMVVAPSAGTVAGIDASGALVIDGREGPRAHRAGSLVFAEAP